MILNWIALPEAESLAQLEKIAAEIALDLSDDDRFNTRARDACLAVVLGSYKTDNHTCMVKMIHGICFIFGSGGTDKEFIHMVLGRVLASCKTSSPLQMGSMILALCYLPGNEQMDESHCARLFFPVFLPLPSRQ